MPTWRVPLSDGIFAEIHVRGRFGLHEARALRRSAEAVEAAYRNGEPGDELEATSEIVQLKPAADAVFGGLLLRVKKRTATTVKGHFLVPHRGGCREAWWSGSPLEIDPIGELKWPECEWGFHRFRWARDGDTVKDLWKLAQG